MGDLLRPLLVFQRFIVPTILILLAWSIWRAVFRKDLAIGLALYVGLVVVVDGFYNTGIYIPGLEQGSIRYSEVCALILILGHKRPSTTTPIRKSVVLLVTAYFLLLFVAALRASPIQAGIFEFRKIAFPQIVAFVLALRGLSSAAEYRRFLLASSVLVMIIATFSLWDILFDRWILHSDMLNKPEYYQNRKNGRFGSILLNPNFLGAFVVLIFPPMFVLTLTEQARKIRIYLGIVLLALLFCLVETQSRAPLIAFGASILLLVFSPIGTVSRKRRATGLAVGIAVFALFMPGFLDHAMERFGSIESETSEEAVSRASVWTYTKMIIAEHPFGGIGFGESQYLQAMEQTDFRHRYGRGSLDNPHNSYLQAAVYAGIPAVLMFALANLTLLTNSLRLTLRRSSQETPTSAMFGLTVGIMGFLASIYPDMHLFTSNIAPLYWMFFGLLIASVSEVSGADVESPPKYGTRRIGPNASTHAAARRLRPAP
jgi:O-antigen ligase